jgi:hypothetical protein
MRGCHPRIVRFLCSSLCKADRPGAKHSQQNSEPQLSPTTPKAPCEDRLDHRCVALRRTNGNKSNPFCFLCKRGTRSLRLPISISALDRGGTGRNPNRASRILCPRKDSLRTSACSSDESENTSQCRTTNCIGASATEKM